MLSLLYKVKYYNLNYLNTPHLCSFNYLYFTNIYPYLYLKYPLIYKRYLK
nr:MAG TPA: hypothetical protein [Caudoviricetes sp.]